MSDSIGFFDGENIGGGQKILHTDIRNLAAPLYVVNGQVMSAIQLVDGAVWSVLEFEHYNYDDGEDDGHGAPMYVAKVSADIYKDDPIKRGICMRLTNRRHLVVCINNNGDRVVLGNQEQGCQFSWKVSHGNQKGDPNRIIISLVARSITPFPFYNAGGISYEDWEDANPGGTWADFLGYIQGPQGEAGESAYETWLGLGNVGSEADFIASLGSAYSGTNKFLPVFDIATGKLKDSKIKQVGDNEYDFGSLLTLLLSENQRQLVLKTRSPGDPMLGKNFQYLAYLSDITPPLVPDENMEEYTPNTFFSAGDELYLPDSTTGEITFYDTLQDFTSGDPVNPASDIAAGNIQELNQKQTTFIEDHDPNFSYSDKSLVFHPTEPELYRAIANVPWGTLLSDTNYWELKLGGTGTGGGSIDGVLRPSGANYDVLLTAANKLIKRDEATANTTTFDSFANVAYPANFQCVVQKLGAGVTKLVFPVGASVDGVKNGSGETIIELVGGTVWVYCEAPDVWTTDGNIEI